MQLTDHIFQQSDLNELIDATMELCDLTKAEIGLLIADCDRRMQDESLSPPERLTFSRYLLPAIKMAIRRAYPKDFNPHEKDKKLWERFMYERYHAFPLFVRKLTEWVKGPGKKYKKRAERRYRQSPPEKKSFYIDARAQEQMMNWIYVEDSNLGMIMSAMMTRSCYVICLENMVRYANGLPEFRFPAFLAQGKMLFRRNGAIYHPRRTARGRALDRTKEDTRVLHANALGLQWATNRLYHTDQNAYHRCHVKCLDGINELIRQKSAKGGTQPAVAAGSANPAISDAIDTYLAEVSANVCPEMLCELCSTFVRRASRPRMHREATRRAVYRMSDVLIDGIEKWGPLFHPRCAQIWAGQYRRRGADNTPSISKFERWKYPIEWIPHPAQQFLHDQAITGDTISAETYHNPPPVLRLRTPRHERKERESKEETEPQSGQRERERERESERERERKRERKREKEREEEREKEKEKKKKKKKKEKEKEKKEKETTHPLPKNAPGEEEDPHPTHHHLPNPPMKPPKKKTNPLPLRKRKRITTPPISKASHPKMLHHPTEYSSSAKTYRLPWIPPPQATSHLSPPKRNPPNQTFALIPLPPPTLPPNRKAPLPWTLSSPKPSPNAPKA